ncbi:hypothetical protein [Methanospirillum hungatei]|uniref:hypothetical protein n=1 Tax=Methanospirillum hungatei TaxID=2203 RepID=UPI0026EDFAB3|nr:hypothetical protein [Methanospirillum hungatei]MCA1917153.1 hypothetical protein [Methanospirillum hungatei]
MISIDHTSLLTMVSLICAVPGYIGGILSLLYYRHYADNTIQFMRSSEEMVLTSISADREGNVHIKTPFDD